MNRLPITLFCCLALCAGIQAQSPSPSDSSSKLTPTTVVATVNGEPIYYKELFAELERKAPLKARKIALQNDPTGLRKLERAALEGLIGRHLLVAEAKKAGNLKENLVQEQLRQLVASYGGESKLELLASPLGLNIEEFKNDVSNDFRIRQYIEDSLAKTIQVTPEEVKARFDLNPAQYAQPEQVRARHILISVAPDAKPEDIEKSRAKIQELYVDAKEPGADFAALAKGNSQCPSAPQGGDLGFFPRGAMVKEFEDVAFSLQPGQISVPIRSQFGFHIIKLEEHRAAADPQFEASKAGIEQQIRLERATEKVRQTIAELRNQSQQANALVIQEDLFK